MPGSRLVLRTTAATTSHRNQFREIAHEMSRVTARDRWLLQLLDDHQVLTTEQVAAIAFPTLAKAQRRLRLLYRRGVLDRFRHAIRPGSQSWRWTLGPLGAGIAAANADRQIPRPAAARTKVNRLAVSPELPRLLGVNQTFCALIAESRRHDDCGLYTWWPAQRAAEACGNYVHPHGHGVWGEASRRVPFWLEYDTGVKSMPELLDKLTGYTELAATALAYPVLVWLPTTARERSLHNVLTRTGIPATVTLATAATERTPDANPAEAVWRLVAGRTDPIRLADIGVRG